ncbi:hypothetical protein T484DRAFT_1823708, partial [Baffinella frigidus]
IPPYFALVIRAIGVLEGIALVEVLDTARIPTCFALVSRAFWKLVIRASWIALVGNPTLISPLFQVGNPTLISPLFQVGNPTFALIDEAFPYLSKRLLTDSAPRLRAALR